MHQIIESNTTGATPSLCETRSAYHEIRRGARAECREARSEWRAAQHEARQEARQARREFRHGSSCHSHSHSRRHLGNRPCGGSSSSRNADVERAGGSGGARGPATPGHPRVLSAGAFLVGTVAKALGIGKGKRQQSQPSGFVEERVFGYGEEETDRRYRNEYRDGKRAVDSEPGYEVTGIVPVRGDAVEIGGVESTTRFSRRVDEDEDEARDEPLPRYEAVVKGTV